MEYSKPTSYVEWSAILAGAVLASALSLVMLQFGTAVGVADIETFRSSLTSVDLTTQQIVYRLIMTGFYILVIQVLASMIGGYVAGRMRAPITSTSEHEKEVRDGVHGVMVWATATLAVAVSVAVVGAFAHIVATDKAISETVSQATLNREHNVAILLAFAAAATSLVSGVAAWAAGVIGGDHRDRSLDFGRYITFLVRR